MECGKIRQTMKLQGLHWVILSQLERRGGHVSWPRIAVGSIAGYIQSLREENAKVGGTGGKSPARKPKNHKTEDGEEGVANPATGHHPEEFINIDLTSMGNELESVLYTNYAWVRNINRAMVDWARSDSLTTENLTRRAVGAAVLCL